MFETIVVAVDGSEGALRALDVATELASKFDSRLAIVHALLRGESPETVKRVAEAVGFDEPIETRPVRMATIGVALMPEYVATESLEKLGNTILNNAMHVAKERGVSDVVAVLSPGDAGDSIADYAEQTNADLVVVGSRGLREIAELFLGSVSAKVLRAAKCGCLVVK